MFKKLLKKKSMAQNVGDLEANNAPGSEENLFPFVVLKDSDSEFIARLKNKVTIGSEVGDLIMAHDQIAPRHCTIFNNRDVYSIIDHSSLAGTFINKKRLDSGKIYLLDEKDKVKLGNLELLFDMREPLVDPDLLEKVIPTMPELPQQGEDHEDETRELDSTVIAKFRSGFLEDGRGDELELDTIVEHEDNFSETEIREINDKSDEHETIIAKKMPFIPKAEEPIKAQPVGNKKVGDKKSTKKIKIKKVSSSNSLMRIIANLNDFLLTYLILNTVSAFREPKLLFDQIAGDIVSFFLVVGEKKIAVLLKVMPEIEQYYSFLFSFSYYLIFFLIFKMLMSLIFSISFGQMIAGIRIEGQFLWKRLIAPIRILLGAFLFPFLIFDIPTIFSKRSFKEVATRTRFITTMGLLGSLMMVICTFIMILAVIIAPLIKGFDILPAIDVLVEKKRSERVVFQKAEYIESLNLTIEDGLLETKFIPFANLRLAKKKKFIDIGLMGIDKNSLSYFKLRKLKTFSFLDILKSFVALNPAASIFYPEVYGLVKNIANQNRNFKLNVQNKDALIAELTRLVKSSYGLDFETLPSFISENGVFLQAHRDFREKFSSLYELAPESLQIKEVGGRFGVEATHGSGKFRYFTFIPLGTLNGSFYRIDGNWNSVKLKRLKSYFQFGQEDSAGDESYLASFINLSQAGIVKDRAEINQSLYAEYFELSKWAMESDKKPILAVLQKSLNQFINILNLDDRSNQKLVQNFSELLQALRDENQEFFSISTTEII